MCRSFLQKAHTRSKVCRAAWKMVFPLIGTSLSSMECRRLGSLLLLVMALSAQAQTAKGSPCDAMPCQNEGQCVALFDSYVCICASGFSGQDCTFDINECDSNPCVNGGTCMDLPGAYKCACPAFFTGSNCETDIHPCRHNPCQNGATCTGEGVDSYTCACAVGYMGSNCEDVLDPCSSNPCQNGSTCTTPSNSFSSFVCDCALGFTGMLCDTDINECIPEPCMNGGVCMDMIGEYICVCSFFWLGVNCTEPLDICEYYQCENNGTCVNQQFFATCTCPENYEGTTCEIYTGPSTTKETQSVTLPVSPDVTSSPPTEENITTEPQQLTYIEDYISTTDPTNTTITVYTEKPATIQLSIETDTPVISTYVVIGVDPEEATVSIMNLTEKGHIEYNIDLSSGAYTTIMVETLEPSDMFVIVTTVDAEKTAALAFGILNITLPTTPVETSASQSVTIAVNQSTTPQDSVGQMTSTPTPELPMSSESAATSQSLNFTEKMTSEPAASTGNMTASPVTDGMDQMTSGPQDVETSSMAVQTDSSSELMITSQASMSVSSDSAATSQSLNFTEKMTSEPAASTGNMTASPATDGMDQMTSGPQDVETSSMAVQTDSSSEAMITSQASMSVSSDSTATSQSLDFTERMTSQPEIDDPNVRILNVQGPSVVKAYASTMEPAFYTLAIYTRNPNQIENLVIETEPEGAARNVLRLTGGDPDGLAVIFQTTGAVNTTLTVELMEAANVSFQVVTQDQSRIIMLWEERVEESSVEPTSVLTTSSASAGPTLHMMTSGAVASTTWISSTTPQDSMGQITSSPTPESPMVSETASSTNQMTASPATDGMDQMTSGPQDVETSSMAVQTDSSSELMITSQASMSVSSDSAATSQSLNFTEKMTSEPAASTGNMTASPATGGMDQMTSGPQDVETSSMAVQTNSSSELMITSQASMSVSSDSTATSQSLNFTERMTSEPAASTGNMTASPATDGMDQMTSGPQDVETSSMAVQTDSSSEPLITTEPQQLTYIEDYISTTDPTNTTITVYTEKPATIQLSIETDTPVISTDVVIGVDPEEATVSIMNLTEKGYIEYNIDLSSGAYTIIMVETLEPSDMFVTVTTVDAEKTAALAFGILNITLPTTPVETSASQSVTIAVNQSTTPQDSVGQMTSTPTPELPMSSESAATSQSLNITERMTSEPAASSGNMTASPATDGMDQMTSGPQDVETSSMAVQTDSSSEQMITSQALTSLSSQSAPTSQLLNFTERMTSEPAAPTSNTTSSTIENTSSQTMTSQTMSVPDETTSQPMDVETTVQTLSTQGPAVVKALASTRSAANYSLIIFTSNPVETVNVSLETVPAGAAYYEEGMVDDDAEALIITFQTDGAVNTTVTVVLMEAANISFEVSTAGQSSVLLAEDLDVTSTEGPAMSTVTMVLHTDPSSDSMITSDDGIETDKMTSKLISAESTEYSPSNATSNPMDATSDPMDATSNPMDATSDPMDATSDPMGATSDPMDASSNPMTTSLDFDSTERMTSQPEVDDPNIRTLSVEGPSVVKAFASTMEPAFYTLVIYTRNPHQIGNVDIETEPEGAATNVLRLTGGDPDGLAVIFKTTGAVNTTLTVELMEAANVSFQVTTQDQSRIIMLWEERVEESSFEPTSMMTSDVLDSSTPTPRGQASTIENTSSLTMTSQTMSVPDETTSQPMNVETTVQTLSTQGPAVVKALASTRSAANYSLIIFTSNPVETVNVSLETVPAGAAYYEEGMVDDDAAALIITFQTDGAVNTTVTVVLMEAANISFEVSTAGQSSVLLAEDLDVTSTEGPAMSTVTMDEHTGSSSDPMMTSEDDIDTDQMTSKLSSTGSTGYSPSNATSNPMDATSDPMDATSDPMDATSNPMGTTSDPMGATSNPMGATSNPMGATSNPMDATSDPMGATSNPMGATSNPMDATSNPMGATSNPMGATSNPMDATSNPMDATSNPMDATSSPMGATSNPMDATSNPMDATSNPMDATSNPMDATSNPMDATSDPMDATSNPMDATSNPMDATSNPMDATSNPMDATSNPMDATSNPMDATSNPMDATSNPMDATSNPMDATSNPMDATSNPMDATSDPMDATSNPMDATSNPMTTSLDFDSTERMTSQPEVDETTSEPMDVEPTVQTLSTQGPAVVKALASTRSAANYSLIIFTSNPVETVNVSLETVPAGAAYYEEGMVDDDAEALIITFQTDGAVNTTVTVVLMEAANISFEVSTAGQSSVLLAEDLDVTSTEGPAMSTVSMAEHTGSSGDPMVTSEDDIDTDQMTSSPPMMTSQPRNFTETMTSLPQGGDDNAVKILSVEGPTVVKGFASTESQASYTLIVQSRDPDETVNVNIETDPKGAAYGVLRFVSDDPEAMAIFFQTTGSVDTTLTIELMEAANISFGVATDDQSLVVLLSEDTSESTTSGEPASPTQTVERTYNFTQFLRNQNATKVSGSVSTSGPANYTLTINTGGTSWTPNVCLKTYPAGAEFDINRWANNSAIFTLTFKTAMPVNTSLVISLLGVANISLEVYSKDPSTVLEIVEEACNALAVPPTMSPMGTPEFSFIEDLTTDESTNLRVFVSTSTPANLSLAVFTERSNETVHVCLDTVPVCSAPFMLTNTFEFPDVFVLGLHIYKASETTLMITLQAPASVYAKLDTGDPVGVLELVEVTDIVPTTMQPAVSSTQMPPWSRDLFNVTRSLSTEGSADVMAFASTSSPANFSLMIMTRSPNETVDVDIETEPYGAALDVVTSAVNDSNIFVMTFKTKEAANTSLAIKLQESASIILQVMTLSQASEVELAVQPAGSTEMPTEEPMTVMRFARFLSVPSGRDVTATVSTGSPASYILSIRTANPGQTASVNVVADPPSALSEVNRLVVSDREVLRITFNSSAAVDVDLMIFVSEQANISLEVDTSDLDSVVMLTEDAVSPTGTVPMTTEQISSLGPSTEEPFLPPALQRVSLSRELRTSDAGDFQARASTFGPGNYSLLIFIPDPSENVDLQTDPGFADIQVTPLEAPEALFVQFTGQEASNTTVFIRLKLPANISFSVETFGEASTVDLVEVSQPMASAVPPSLPEGSTTAAGEGTPMPPAVFLRELSTSGPTSVQATAISEGPAEFEVVIYTRDPTQTASIDILTIPQGLVTNLEQVRGTEPERLTITFRTPAAALTTLSASLLESANITLRVVATNTSVVSLTDGSQVTPELSTTTSAPTISQDPYVIRRMVQTRDDASVEASVSLDRPVNISVVIYTSGSDEVSGVTLLTEPSGISANVRIEKLQDPAAYILHFQTLVPAKSTVTFDVADAANVTLIVWSSSPGQASDEVELFVVGGETPTANPSPAPTTIRTTKATTQAPTTNTPAPDTDVVLMNATQTVRATGPSQNLFFISATSAAVILIDASGFLELNLTTLPASAVRVDDFSSSSMRTFIRLAILQPVNFTLTAGTDRDVDIVATVLSEMSDAAEVTIVPIPLSPPTTTARQETARFTLVKSFQTLTPGTSLGVLASLDQPANITLTITTPNPTQTTNVHVQPDPSDAILDTSVQIDTNPDSITTQIEIGIPSTITIMMTLAELGNISLEVTNIAYDGQVRFLNASTAPTVTEANQDATDVPLPTVPDFGVVSNTTRSASTPGPAGLLGRVTTLWPSAVYIITNVSAEISVGAAPRGSVLGEPLQVAGATAYKLITTVPATITFFISTSEAALVQIIVESPGFQPPVILLDGEVDMGDLPFLHLVTMPNGMPVRHGDPVVNATAVVDGQANVTWSFSEGEEPFIRGFVVQYRDVGSTTWQNSTLQPPSSRQFLLTNLDEELLYVIRVVAISRDGNQAALSFQKPLMALSRDITDPIAATDKESSSLVDSGFWLPIFAGAVVLVLLLLVVVGLLVLTRRGKARGVKGDGSDFGEEDVAVQDDRV